MKEIWIKTAIVLDEVRTFFKGKKAPVEHGLFSFCRKIAFKESVRILAAIPGKEIKFIDKNSTCPDDFLGWAFLKNGVLDIHYKIKKKRLVGGDLYLTRFSGDDVLEYIFEYFEDEIVDKVECVLQQSNLEAFNKAFAKEPGDKVWAVRNTHIGNYFLNLKNWHTTTAEIDPFGDAGPMRAGIMEPAKASFEEVNAIFSPVFS